MKVALGQINPTIGDFDGNRRLIEDAHAAAAAGGADLIVFPELALSGYPPKDLLERPAFLDAAAASLDALATTLGRRETKTAALVGFPARLPTAKVGQRVANAAALIDAGRVVAIAHKSLLPTYDVFDEWRYFEPAADVTVAPLAGRRLGLSICEDIWNDADFWPQRRYRVDPIERLIAAGADVIINISASPFSIEKRHLRPRMLAATARHWSVPLVFVNQVGGQDDLIFDGASAVYDRQGQVLARAREHAPDLIVADLAAGTGPVRAPAATDEESALDALVLGTRDYARRCGFRQALLGLSGGIDSALCACIAAEALGPENVLGVAMPSRFSSAGSLADARALATNLGMGFDVVPIEAMFAAYLHELGPVFARHEGYSTPAGLAGQPGRPPDAPDGGSVPDLAAENLQARIRGAILMALSNKYGRLLVTTGNKSEIATGYCTLYGDMAGGLAVISDVPKTMVYRLAHAFNRTRGGRWPAGAPGDSGAPAPVPSRASDGGIIPHATLTKAPSAELRPNQKDQDSLPPYDVLDAILEAHLEQGQDAAALVASGFSPAAVEDVVRRVRTSEYKRRQMPPGLKVTGKAFGPGRRIPIAQAWRG